MVAAIKRARFNAVMPDGSTLVLEHGVRRRDGLRVSMNLADFRKRCPYLVHYAPQIDLTRGLLTAAQVLDRNADAAGNVWARFRKEKEFRAYPVDHWKTHSRFLRRALEEGSCLIVRDVTDPDRHYVLGNNYPLGDGACLGTTIPLTDNRPGDTAPTREQWFRMLNDLFWVFAETKVNAGFVKQLQLATPDRKLDRVRFRTNGFSDDELLARVRLSRINGGAANGIGARGTATYKTIPEWTGWPPKEIGLLGGLPAELCAALLGSGDLSVQEA